MKIISRRWGRCWRCSGPPSKNSFCQVGLFVWTSPWAFGLTAGPVPDCFCPRKLHPFGNEYHTICCDITGILSDFEMVKGTDRPPQMILPRYSEPVKTASLLMRLCESIAHSCHYTVLDSGFWVLAAICGLHSIMGIFVGAWIKKHKYWPALAMPLTGSLRL